MSDATQEFKIKVISEADNTGWKSSAQSAEDLKHNSDRVGQSFEETNKATEKLGHGMNQARLRGELFRRVMMAIGEYTPGLEYAIMGGASAFGAITAAAIGGGIALEKLIQYFHSFDEALQNLNAGEIEDHARVLGRLHTAWGDLDTAMAKYFADLKHAGDDSSPFVKQIEAAKKLKVATLDAQKTILTTIELERESVIREEGKQEGQSPEQIEKTVAAARSRSQSKIDAIQSQIDMAQGSGALVAELAASKGAEKQIEAEAVQAMLRAAGVKLKLDNTQDDIKKLRDATGKGEKGALDPVYGETQKNIQKAQEHLDYQKKVLAQELEDWKSGRSMIAHPEAYFAGLRKNVSDAQAELTAQENIQKLRNSLLEQDLKLESKLKDELADANVTAETAQGAAKENRKRIVELPQEIRQSQQLEHVADHTRKLTEEFSQHGGKMNLSLGELLNLTHKTNAQQINIAEQLIAGQLNLHAVFSKLEMQLRRQQAQISSMSRRP